MTRSACRGLLLSIVGLVWAQIALCAVGKWTPLGPFATDGSPIFLSAFTVAPDGVLYATAYSDDTVYRSDDAGGRWVALDGLRGVNGVWSLAADPLMPSTLYAGTAAGLYRSTDSGDSFVSIWTDQIVYGLVFDRNTPGTLYAATGPKSIDDVGAVFRSLDGGESWTRVLASDDPYQFVSIAIDPLAPGHVYAGTYRGRFFRSADAGVTWTEVFGDWVGAIGCIAIDPHSPSTVYATSAGARPLFPPLGSVVRSLDSGSTFAALSGLPDINVGGVAVDPRTPSHVLVSADGAVYESTDAGMSWAPLGGASTPISAAIFFDPFIPSHLYLASGTVYDILLGSGRSPVEPTARPRPRVPVLPPRR